MRYGFRVLVLPTGPFLSRSLRHLIGESLLDSLVLDRLVVLDSPVVADTLVVLYSLVVDGALVVGEPLVVLDESIGIYVIFPQS